MYGGPTTTVKPKQNPATSWFRIFKAPKISREPDRTPLFRAARRYSWTRSSKDRPEGTVLDKRIGQSLVGPWNWLRVQLFLLLTDRRSGHSRTSRSPCLRILPHRQ